MLAAVLFVAGCGGDGSAEDDVRETVEGYFTALSERDYGVACAALSPSFREGLAVFAARSFPELDSNECEAIAARIAAANGDRLVGLQGRVRVGAVEVDGDAATAQLGPGQTATLDKVDGEWLIDRLDFSGATG